MSEIDNTTARMKEPAENLLFLGEAMATGSATSFIENQERAGQSQLVHSDRLPSDIMGDRAEFEALGFTFGEPDPDDPLFMPATLPAGWEKRATDHSMGSVIVDTAGRGRVSIFYKAAFYDRSAHMNLIGLDWYVTCHVEYDGPLVITDEWATRESVAAALARGREGALAEAAEWRSYGPSETSTKYVTQHEEAAAKYAALLADLEAGDQS